MLKLGSPPNYPSSRPMKMNDSLLQYHGRRMLLAFHPLLKNRILCHCLYLQEYG